MQISVPRTFTVVLIAALLTSGAVAAYFLVPFTTYQYEHVEGTRAAIVDALSELDPNPEFESTATQYLTQAGMLVDVYSSAQITVDFMKSFPAGYVLVVFRVHSATGRDGVFYFTAESYDESKYQPEQYRDELREGKDYEGHPPVFTFGAKFVDTYLRDRFQGAVIIGMGCFGAGTSFGTDGEVTVPDVKTQRGPNLADAFYRQGALAVIGWDSLVALEFSDRATIRLLKALAIQRLTIKQATEAVNLDVGEDPVFGARLVFYPEHNGEKTLLLPQQAGEAQTSELTSAVLLVNYCKSADQNVSAWPAGQTRL